ncbi:MAG: response regulator transcription factor [Candidatus Omnitrophica bacterium]|nr:response regulator transcription factor [Candidatus Omnitrophota bacterium]MDD5487982.1 response regulator transcription factor [Candidatus Omnitrophota bacterium]
MEKKKLVAVVDDSPDILKIVSLHLEKAGFLSRCFKNAGSFLNSLKSETPDFLILDLILPDMDGFDVCKHMRSDPALKNIPILMLTAKDEEVDKVLGLELGADDYVTKPFMPRELMARVKTILKRYERPEEESDSTIRFGDLLSIDETRHEVILNGKSLVFTPTEFKILKLLCASPGQVFTREAILKHLWGSEKVVVKRTVDVHIRHIREKLGKYADIVKNVPGVGYKSEL